MNARLVGTGALILLFGLGFVGLGISALGSSPLGQVNSSKLIGVITYLPIGLGLGLASVLVLAFGLKTKAWWPVNKLPGLTAGLTLLGFGVGGTVGLLLIFPPLAPPFGIDLIVGLVLLLRGPSAKITMVATAILVPVTLIAVIAIAGFIFGLFGSFQFA